MWLKKFVHYNPVNKTVIIANFILRIYAIMHITITFQLDDVNATFKARFEQNIEYYCKLRIKSQRATNVSDTHVFCHN